MEKVKAWKDPRTGEEYKKRPVGRLKSGLESRYLVPIYDKEVKKVVVEASIEQDAPKREEVVQKRLTKKGKKKYNIDETYKTGE